MRFDPMQTMQITATSGRTSSSACVHASSTTPSSQAPALLEKRFACGGATRGTGYDTHSVQGNLFYRQLVTSEWRNWQTRRLKVPVSLGTWGFKSPLRHHKISRFRAGDFVVLVSFANGSASAWVTECYLSCFCLRRVNAPLGLGAPPLP